MTQNQRKLIFSSLFIIIVMIALVPTTTGILGLKTGIFISMVFYWLGLCLPLSVYFLGWSGIKSSLSLATHDHAWVPIVALALPVIMVVYLLLDVGQIFGITLLFTVLPFALLNGTLEEVYWRGTYAKLADNSRIFWALGLILFTAWHIALIFAAGVVHQGGAATLLGGAFGLGLVWTVMTYVTHRIGWNVISHVLINVVTFSLAFSQN